MNRRRNLPPHLLDRTVALVIVTFVMLGITSGAALKIKAQGTRRAESGASARNDRVANRERANWAASPGSL
jgi:hypothetical protein